MLLSKLPATLNKKDEKGNPLPNIVKVTNNVRLKADYEGKKDESGNALKVPPVEFEIPAESFEFPVYENYAEFVATIGGEKEALEFINDEIMKAATSAGKAVIRTATSGTQDEIIAAGLRTSKNYSPKTEATLSLKERAAGFDELAALATSGAELDPQEVIRRLMALVNK